MSFSYGFQMQRFQTIVGVAETVIAYLSQSRLFPMSVTAERIARLDQGNKRHNWVVWVFSNRRFDSVNNPKL